MYAALQVRDINSPSSAKHRARLVRNFEVAKAQVDRDLHAFKAEVHSQQDTVRTPSPETVRK
jgi:hypothetical protein